MTTGFDGVGTKLDGGFAAVNTGLEGLTGTVNTRSDGILENQNTGFSNLQTGLSDSEKRIIARQQAAEDSLSALARDNQAANLQQQQEIASIINQYGGNLDAYYTDLAASNVASAERQGALQTGLAAFQSDQANQNTLSNSQQAQLLDTINSTAARNIDAVAALGNSTAAGFTGLGSDLNSGLGGLGNDLNSGLGGLGNDLTGLSGAFNSKLSDATDTMADVTSASADSLINAVSAGNSAADNRFGEIASLISSGFQSNDPKFTELKTDFLGRLELPVL